MATMWSVPKIWDGERVFILGGGPSLAKVDLSSLSHSNFKVIGVNCAYTLGDWVDVCWFGDPKWYDWNRTGLITYGGLIVTCAPAFINRKCPSRIKVLMRGKKTGIDERPNRVSWNLNSGASAINLAYHFGAKEVILLGFDMKPGNGKGMLRYNWHSLHKARPSDKVYAERYLPSFSQIKKDAYRLGMSIYNATERSELREFPFMLLEDALLNENT